MDSTKSILQWCMFHMNQYFDGWENCQSAYFIPPSPLSPYEGPSEEGATGWSTELHCVTGHHDRGHEAEALVHRLLEKFDRSAPQPMFVIQGLDVNHFKKLFAEESDIISQSQWQNDFLIVHAYLGFILFEVKGVDNYKNNTYMKCKEQLNIVDQSLQKIFAVISDAVTIESRTDSLCPPIYKVICFPHVAMKRRDDANNIMNIGLEEFKDFALWWAKAFNKRHLSKSIFHDTVAASFLAASIGGRSTVELSYAINVMDIYKRIDKQSFYQGAFNMQKNKGWSELIKQPMDPLLKEQFFFLNPEQITVWECPLPWLIIGGPPGTGKTLLLMQKALSSTAQCNREVIVLCPDSLTSKYQCFFKAHGQLNVPVISFELLVEAFETFVCYLNGKDVFVDEFQWLLEVDTTAPSEVEKWMKLKENTSEHLLQYAINEHQRTNLFWIACMSSLVSPSYVPSRKVNVEKLNTSVQQLMNDGFILHEMSTVVRGTKEIVRYWRTGLDALKGQSDKTFASRFFLGHSVQGPTLHMEIINEPNQLFAKLSSELEKIFKPIEMASKENCASRLAIHDFDVAILCDTEFRKKEITTFLRVKNREVSSISEQTRNRIGIAVDLASNSLSYEWPVVFYIQDFSFSQYVTPLSRAISKLLVFRVLGTAEDDVDNAQSSSNVETIEMPPVLAQSSVPTLIFDAVSTPVFK